MVLAALYPWLFFSLYFDTFQYNLLQNSQMWSKKLEFRDWHWFLVFNYSLGGWKINYIKHKVLQCCQFGLRQRINLSYSAILRLNLAKQSNPCYSMSLRYLTITTGLFCLKHGASWLQYDFFFTSLCPWSNAAWSNEVQWIFLMKQICHMSSWPCCKAGPCSFS